MINELICDFEWTFTSHSTNLSFLFFTLLWFRRVIFFLVLKLQYLIPRIFSPINNSVHRFFFFLNQHHQHQRNIENEANKTTAHALLEMDLFAAIWFLDSVFENWTKKAKLKEKIRKKFCIKWHVLLVDKLPNKSSSVFFLAHLHNLPRYQNKI